MQQHRHRATGNAEAAFLSPTACASGVGHRGATPNSAESVRHLQQQRMEGKCKAVLPPKWSTGARAAAAAVPTRYRHPSRATRQKPLSRKQIIYRRDGEESTARRRGGLQQLICNHSLNQDVPVTASVPRVPGVGACGIYLQAIGHKQAVMLNQMMLEISRKTEMKMSNLLSFGVLSPERGQEGLREVV